MTRKSFLPFLLALLSAFLGSVGFRADPGGGSCCRSGSCSSATPAPKPITDADVAGAPVPTADARAKGDPDGSLTCTRPQ